MHPHPDSPRVAVYTAGDANIFFPALVAFKSIREHNADLPFDYFMCFDREGLTPRMSELMDRYDVRFLDTAELSRHGSIEDLALMTETVWPSEVFLNWVAPLHFAEAGYSHALKVDYDILCVAPYALADILMHSETFGGNTWGQLLLKDGITAGTLAMLGLPGYSSQSRTAYFNVGFVAINLDRYVEGKVFDRFKEVYSVLQAQDGSVNVAEQAAICIIAAVDGHKVRHLGKDYNMRVTQFPELSGDLMPVIRNIHFLTSNKPWRPVSFKYLKHYITSERAGLFFYRNIWLNAASEVDGFAEFVAERPLSEMQMVGLWSRVMTDLYAAHRTALASKKA